MVEAWAMYTVENKWRRPTLLEFNDWLKHKVEANERTKVISVKPKSDENSPATTRTKTAAEMLAQKSKADAPTVGRIALPTKPVGCTDCKETHHLRRCPVFRGKTPTQRAEVVTDNNLRFLCLNGQHFYRQCPKPRNCTAEGCSKTHALLNGAECVPT